MVLRTLVFITLIFSQIGCISSYLDEGTLTAKDRPILPLKDIFQGQVSSGIFGQHPFCSDIKFASDDYQHYSEAYDSRYYEMAVEAYLFAWMASNTYEDYDGGKPEFKLDAYVGWNKLETIRTWRGLGAQVYESYEGSQVVIAFEGTNGWSIKDWIFGNFNPFGLGQYKEAVKIASAIRKRHPNSQLIVTGHSLGGSLAIHVALRFDDTSAYVFNTSPKIFTPKRKTKGSLIYLIGEDRDILKQVREKIVPIDSRLLAGVFDKYYFVHSDNITEHSIYYIARGLTMVAGFHDSKSRDIAETLLLDEKGKKRRGCSNLCVR